MDGHGAALVGRALEAAVAAPRPSERRRAAARQEIVDDCPSVDDRCCATTRTTSALVSLLVCRSRRVAHAARPLLLRGRASILAVASAAERHNSAGAGDHAESL